MTVDRKDTPWPNHQPFFEALGNMREENEQWTAIMAGLVTLRLVDKWELAMRGRLLPLPAEVASVRRAVADVTVDEMRQALAGIVDAIANAWGQRVPAVTTRVLAYASLLYHGEQWALAADVYRTFLLFASTANDMDLAAHAWVRLGTALTMIGDLRAAERAHETGRAMALEQHKRHVARLAEHGLAVIALHRGNLPAADEALGAVIAACQAEIETEPSLIEVLARALHDRGWVALRRQDTTRAFPLLYEAMQRAPEERKKERVLHDLATAFMDVGDQVAARDGFAILERRAKDPTVRWGAALNLMHLAVVEGSETTFERYRRALGKETLPPRFAVDYRIYEAEGCWRFGRREQARTAFKRAIALAELHQFGEQVIAAEATLSALERLATADSAVVEAVSVREEPVVLGPEIARVARALREMRAELVGAG